MAYTSASGGASPQPMSASAPQPKSAPTGSAPTADVAYDDYYEES